MFFTGRCLCSRRLLQTHSGYLRNTSSVKCSIQTSTYSSGSVFSLSQRSFRSKLSTCRTFSTMRKSLRDSSKITLSLIAGGMGVMLGYMGFYLYNYNTRKPISLDILTKSLIGGPFDLVDQDGKQRTEKDFEGKYYIIYFGFSDCPDICPVAMKTLKRTLAICKAWKLPSISPIFISVDPRETIEKLKKYSEDPNNPDDMIYLTGSVEKLLEVTKAYRTYTNIEDIVQRLKDKGDQSSEDDTEWLVDHSDFMYLGNESGEHLVVLNPRKHSAETIATEIRKQTLWDQETLKNNTQ